MNNFIKFIKNNGIPLNDINPGSDEFALNYDNLLVALEIANEESIAIIGGDVLTIDHHGDLIYAYQQWGEQYIYLNWSCDRIENEDQFDYIIRSISIASEKIEEIKNISNNLSQIFLVSLIF